VATYDRYLEEEDDILLETTKRFVPTEYKEKSRILTTMLKAVVLKLPHRNVSGLRKRYLRLHGVVKSKEECDRIKRDRVLSPGPKASYVPATPPVPAAQRGTVCRSAARAPVRREAANGGARTASAETTATGFGAVPQNASDRLAATFASGLGRPAPGENRIYEPGTEGRLTSRRSESSSPRSTATPRCGRPE